MTTESDYEEYSPTVLYDVFAEAETMLGGWLNALQDQAEVNGDTELAQRWAQEELSVAAERKAVRVDDRRAQIQAIIRWNARRDELDAFFPTSPRA